jgi:hypothetical protein
VKLFASPTVRSGKHSRSKVSSVSRSIFRRIFPSSAHCFSVFLLMLPPPFQPPPLTPIDWHWHSGCRCRITTPSVERIRSSWFSQQPYGHDTSMRVLRARILRPPNAPSGSKCPAIRLDGFPVSIQWLQEDEGAMRRRIAMVFKI